MLKKLLKKLFKPKVPTIRELFVKHIKYLYCKYKICGPNIDLTKDLHKSANHKSWTQIIKFILGSPHDFMISLVPYGQGIRNELKEDMCVWYGTYLVPLFFIFLKENKVYEDFLLNRQLQQINPMVDQYDDIKKVMTPQNYILLAFQWNKTNERDKWASLNSAWMKFVGQIFEIRN